MVSQSHFGSKPSRMALVAGWPRCGPSSASSARGSRACTGAKPKPQLPSTTEVTPCQPEMRAPRVPADLGVVVGVQVDGAGGDDAALGVDHPVGRRRSARPPIWAIRPSLIHRSPAVARHPGAVDDRAALDVDVVLGRWPCGLPAFGSPAPSAGARARGYSSTRRAGCGQWRDERDGGRSAGDGAALGRRRPTVPGSVQLCQEVVGQSGRRQHLVGVGAEHWRRPLRPRSGCALMRIGGRRRRVAAQQGVVELDQEPVGRIWGSREHVGGRVVRRGRARRSPAVGPARWRWSRCGTAPPPASTSRVPLRRTGGPALPAGIGQPGDGVELVLQRRAERRRGDQPVRCLPVAEVHAQQVAPAEHGVVVEGRWASKSAPCARSSANCSSYAAKRVGRRRRSGG